MNVTNFLRAVCECPDDDGPRLVYADWLEEHGQPERAEFIRVQCELAGPYKVTGVDLFGETHPGEVVAKARERERPRREFLAKRAAELLLAHWTEWAEWAKGLNAGYCLNLYDGLPFVPPNIAVEFRRGFVEAIQIGVERFMGVCERCQGYYCDRDCHACAGSGKMAAALALSCPLREVRLTDREPQNYHNNPLLPEHPGPLFGWWREQNEQYQLAYNLPPPLWDEVAKHPHRIDNERWADFRCRDTAHAALSAACVRHARTLAGLP